MDWIDHPANPLIEPRWWNWLAGDPTLLAPEQTPDRRWHLFCNNLLGIYQYHSVDGVRWRLLQRTDRFGIRPWILPGEACFHLYFQRFHRFFRSSRLLLRSSRDLLHWSRPRTVLRPDLPWEGRHVSNPCVLVAPESGFWLYYSADQVYLKDMSLWEPRHISRAWAPAPGGPWVKHGTPLFGPEPEPSQALRSVAGAGAIKVYKGFIPGHYVGFQNRIYRNRSGQSTSAVGLLRSPDGLRWEAHPDNPILAPSGGTPHWRRAQVYQVDLKRVGRSLRLYYNARDGRRFGRERIGLAVLKDASRLWPEAPQ